MAYKISSAILFPPFGQWSKFDYFPVAVVMIVLALDTSLSLASACLWESRKSIGLARESVPLERGHETILLGLISKVLSAATIGFASIDRIAVTVGPGSFTGLRIGVSAARAFGLATGKPVVGVSTLAAFAAASTAPDCSTPIVAAIDARKGRVFAQAFTAGGRPLTQACLSPAAAFLEGLGPGPLRLVGSGAPLLAIAATLSGRKVETPAAAPGPDIDAVARLGAVADPHVSPPKPLYLESVAAMPTFGQHNS